MIKISDAAEILEPYMFKSAGKVNIKDAIEAINKARQELIDFIADNIDADYEKLTDFDGIEYIETYVPKGQLEEIKKMIR